jgi:hypothetical protein
MRRLLLAAFVIAVASPVFAQSVYQKEAEIRAAVPYASMLRERPGLTLQDYNQAVRRLAEAEAGVTRQTVPAPPAYSAPTYRPPVYTPPTRYRAPSNSTQSSGSSYDVQSGNSYRWRKSPDGVTKVDGMNLNTGSMWNTTIKPNGSMNGWDSQMNPWSYDSRSKTYMNYGTGKMCVGEGYARSCF